MDDMIEQMDAWYRDIGPSLFAYFRHQPTLASTAEDLVQEVFIRALRHPERLRSADSPPAYLFGIARHVGLDALRRMRPMESLPPDVASPALAEDARLESMRVAIAGLPELHREPLLLKLRHELSYEEIAAVLDIPVGTVRSRLHHAVALLKQALNAA